MKTRDNENEEPDPSFTIFGRKSYSRSFNAQMAKQISRAVEIDQSPADDFKSLELSSSSIDMKLFQTRVKLNLIVKTCFFAQLAPDFTLSCFWKVPYLLYFNQQR